MLALVCCTLLAQAPATEVRAKHGMVASVCPIATDVGVAVLKAGGNAVDAAVAVAFAEAVTWPEAGNIGGGGFMLVRPPSGQPTFIDYRETAPAAAAPDLFARGIDYQSHVVSGVPGTVRGMEMAHRRFGKKPWKELVQPAVRLAADGFPVDGPLAGRLNTAAKAKNPEFRRVYGKPERWKAGDTLKLPDLAKTLARIAEQGADAFYTGETADLIAAEMKTGGGLITKADLAAYRAKERTPLRGSYRGYEIVAAPPPSSGGTAILEALNILERFEVSKHPRQSAETIHLLAEAQRRAFADRARHLGDPDFVSVPSHLTSKEYAANLAAGIDPTRATKSEAVAPEIEVKDGGNSTTHFSIVDADGMAVANTYTLENAFGSHIVVRGAGFILNNEMTDFNHIPGRTTRTGLIGTPANVVAPGKRMLSSMTPTIVAKDGKLVLVTGSPGGRTIINTVLCVLVNTIDYKLPPRAAVDELRQHHQWFPDRIQLERAGERPELVEKLKAMGHTIAPFRAADSKSLLLPTQGDAHTIGIDPVTGDRLGAADRRLNGKAAGY